MKKEHLLKVVPAIGLAACLAVSAPALASTKRAADLASMCADEAVEAQERCIGYIQGYLDALQLSADEEQTSWSQRAINTRIGTKLKTRYGHTAKAFCVDSTDAVAQIQERIAQHSEVNDVPATAWIDAIARSEFPCEPASS